MSNVRQNTPREVSPLSALTDPGEIFKNPSQLTFIRTLLDILRTTFGNIVRRDQATPQIILTDPAGIAWVVTIGEDGVLQAVRVRG